MTVHVQIDDHPGEARPYVLGDIAKCLNVEKAEVVTVLTTWSRAQLVAHLEQFTAAELMPPRFRK